MVPRRAAEPRLEPLALPLPAARVPVRRPGRRERPPRQARPRVRAARHRASFDDDRYWIVEVDYAKADPHDLLHDGARSRTPGPDADTLHVLPTAVVPQHLVVGRRRRAARAAGRRATARSCTEHPFLGPLELVAEPGPTAPPDAAVLRQRDERRAALRRARRPRTRRTASTTTSSTGADTVEPGARGHQGRAAGTSVEVAPARPSSCALRLRPPSGRERRPRARLRRGRCATAQAEADEFYAELTPAEASADEAHVHAPGASPGCCGASSSTTTTSRAGSTATRRSRRRPPSRRDGRNAALAALRRLRHHVDAGHVGVPVVRGVGPRLPLRRARARRPGVREVPADPALPRVVPAPERRAARLRVGVRRRQPAGAGVGGARGVRRSTAAATSTSSSRVFDKLLVNFTWWVNREDADGSNLFEGGFLGLDNIGPIDRSHLPAGRTRSSSPTRTGWMAFYALNMAAIARDPQPQRPPGDATSC